MATTPSFSPPAGRKGYVGETGFVPPNRRPFELPVKEFTSGTPERLAPMPQQAGKSSFFSFRKQSSAQDNVSYMISTIMFRLNWRSIPDDDI